MKTLTVTFDVTDLNDDEIAALTGEVIVQGESSDDHGHAPFLTESITETVEADAVTKALAAMLSEDKGEIETVISSGIQTGRGPSGKLRNFAQMKDSKLIDVCDTIMDENNDEEAMEAISQEMKSRGL